MPSFHYVMVAPVQHWASVLEFQHPKKMAASRSLLKFCKASGRSWGAIVLRRSWAQPMSRRCLGFIVSRLVFVLQYGQMLKLCSRLELKTSRSSAAPAELVQALSIITSHRQRPSSHRHRSRNRHRHRLVLVYNLKFISASHSVDARGAYATQATHASPST